MGQPLRPEREREKKAANTGYWNPLGDGEKSCEYWVLGTPYVNKKLSILGTGTPYVMKKEKEKKEAVNTGYGM